MRNADAVVIIIEDDASMREAIMTLIETVGLNGHMYASGQEFLQYSPPDGPSCLVLDVRLPGLSGLNLQRELAMRGMDIPIIFITGHGDIPMSVQAMKAGAVEFLTKPFRDQDLLDAIAQALERDRAARRRRADMTALRQRYDTLTAREREVMQLTVAGLPNKQIASELGTSEKTVNIQRGRMMQKMQADSIAALVRIAEKLDM
jgi:RNA polymerase sigma factor (sigma-70 family)